MGIRTAGSLQFLSILFSPDEYVRLMDEVNDARLLTIATERMAHYDPSSLIYADDVNRELGISSEDLEGFDEVAFE